jgi:hypothetical protein
MCRSYCTAFAAHPPEPNDSPFCNYCGSPLRLIKIEAVPGGEKHTLKCSQCRREENVLITPPARGTT